MTREGGRRELVGEFSTRFGLGLDAPWYLAQLVAIGWVPIPLLAIGVVWAAGAAQLAALATGRYAPYPSASERPRLGPLRRALRSVVLAVRHRRRASDRGPRALEG